MINQNTEQLKSEIIRILEDLKAESIESFDVSSKSLGCDYAIIATGRSGRHVKAVQENLITELKSFGYKGVSIDGKNSDWLVVDLGDIIVHIMTQEVRETYRLEELMAKKK